MELPASGAQVQNPMISSDEQGRNSVKLHGQPAGEWEEGLQETSVWMAGTPISGWRLFLVACLVTGLDLLVIIIFSDVFSTGPMVIEALVDFGGYNTTIFCAVALLIVTFYLLDISYWNGWRGRMLRPLCALLAVASTIALGVSLVRSYPYLPLCIFILLLPATVLCLSATLLRRQGASGSAWALGLAFFVASLFSLGVWLAWLSGAWGGGTNGNNYWYANRAQFAKDALCNATDFDNVDFEVDGTYVLPDGTIICTAAFLLWISPFILFGVLLFIALFLCILGWSLDSNPKHSGREALRVLAIAAFTCMFGMYSVTSIGGSGMKLANVAMSTFFCILVGIVFCGAAAIGRERSLKTYKNLGGNVLAFFEKNPAIANLGRAFFLCVGTPLLFFLYGLSFLNQCIRRCGFNRGSCQPLPAEEARQPFTKVYMVQLKALRSWDWSTVLKYMYYLCAFVWLFIYFSKVTYIFFNWLVSVLKTMAFGLVVAIFVCIGLVMFLIPVVPGPAVYLTAGVLVVPLAKQKFSGGAGGFNACDALDESGSGVSETDNALWAFWLACAFTSCISFALKLIAHVLQQKLIGECLSGYVSVRAIVGPNSRSMRAVRYLLSQPGLTIAKASILCGGPDWPTSVLCGLLKLNVFQMLIGLTPIIIFTTPGTLLGAFMTEPTYQEMNLDTVCTLVLLLIQVLMCVAFMHYINLALLEHADELDAYETDVEVERLDVKAAQYAAIVKEVGSFYDAPWQMRAMLVSGVVAGLVSTYALYFGSSRLFQEFSITDCLDTLGVPEEDYILPFLGMKPYGLVAILLMFYGAICLKFFNDCWVHEQARKKIEELTRTRGPDALSSYLSDRSSADVSGRALSPAPTQAPAQLEDWSPPPSAPAPIMSRLGSKASSGSIDGRDSESQREGDDALTPRSRDAVVSIQSNARHHVSTSL